MDPQKTLRAEETEGALNITGASLPARPVQEIAVSKAAQFAELLHLVRTIEQRFNFQSSISSTNPELRDVDRLHTGDMLSLARRRLHLSQAEVAQALWPEIKQDASITRRVSYVEEGTRRLIASDIESLKKKQPDLFKMFNLLCEIYLERDPCDSTRLQLLQSIADAKRFVFALFKEAIERGDIKDQALVLELLQEHMDIKS